MSWVLRSFGDALNELVEDNDALEMPNYAYDEVNIYVEYTVVESKVVEFVSCLVDHKTLNHIPINDRGYN